MLFRSTGTIISKAEKGGSWQFIISYPQQFAALIIEKGSVTVNGISLTAFNINDKSFEVAIIPYTYEHTTVKHLKEGDKVNLEFDVIGKYINRIQQLLISK